jgi:hypothetical protein
MYRERINWRLSISVNITKKSERSERTEYKALGQH